MQPRPASLERQVGLPSAIAIIVASMIGQGIFTTPGFVGHDLQHPGLMLALWVVGGVLSLIGALCYAELATLIPRAGGEYAYLHAAFGPLTGFLCGWGCFLGGFSAPIALCALTFSQHAATFFPSIHPRSGIVLPMPFGGSLPLANVVAALLILVFTLAHCSKVSNGLRLQNALTAVKATIIIVLAGAALASGNAETSRLFETGTVPTGWSLASTTARSLIFVTLTYAGWNGATYIAGEVKDPRRVLPRAMIIGTLAVASIYILMNVVYLLAVPVTRMQDAANIALLAATTYFGSAGERAIAFVISATQLASLSAFILTGSRVYFAMAEDGVAPRALSRVADRARAPRTAVALQGAIAIVMTLSTEFYGLAEYAGVVLSLFSALAAASLLKLRKSSAAGPESFRAPFGLATPIAYLAINAGILLFFGLEKLEKHPWQLFGGIASVLAGLPIYWWITRAQKPA